TRLHDVRVAAVDLEVRSEGRGLGRAPDGERLRSDLVDEPRRAVVDVERAVALAKKSGIGVDGDGRSRAVRADPFESSSIALEEIKRPSDEDAGDGRLARAHRLAATGRQLDDARLVRQGIEDRDLIL